MLGVEYRVVLSETLQREKRCYLTDDFHDSVAVSSLRLAIWFGRADFSADQLNSTGRCTRHDH